MTERARQNSPNGHRILVPKGGTLEVTYEFSVDNKQPISYANVLGTIVEAARVNSSGGRFAVKQDGEVFHVVPTQVRDIDGKWVQQASILDTPITLHVEGQNCYQVIKAILAEVSKVHAVEIGLGTGQFQQTLKTTTSRVSSINQPARDALMSALHTMSDRFTFRLLYDPGLKYYMLNVRFAAEPLREPTPTQIQHSADGPSPAGGKRTQPN